MKQLDFLDNLFSAPDIKIIDMKKGLTNQNFLLEMNHDRFVLRVPYNDSAQIVHRKHESMALRAIENCDIDVETIYYDEVSGYKVTRYVEDAKSFQSCPYPDKIERTAALMKYFHNLNKLIDEDFQPLERLKLYQSQIKEPYYDLRLYNYILDEVANMHNKKVLCHNDWVAGNILFTENKTYLIDYEYAANNDPLFDVMSFLTENKITNKSDRKRFYKVYFDEMNPAIEKDLATWEDFHNLLWCNWAMMMWENRHDDIYKEIAKDKYDALCKKHKSAC